MSAIAIHREPQADASEHMAFSVVICTVGHDRVGPLRRLLASLERQSVLARQIIVVDQNPTDILGFVLQQFPSLPLQRIRSEPGLSRARNAGLALVRGDIVAFPDDDCWYGPQVFAQVVRLFHDHPQLAVVTGRTTDDTGRESLGAFRSRPTDITTREFVDCGNSNSLFMRRAAVETIGDFDIRLGVGAATPFGSGEEADYLLRGVALGLPTRYFPSLVVFHEQVEAVYDDRTLSRARTYSRGFGALMRKHRLGLGYLLHREVRTLASATLALLSLRPARARYKLAWFLGVAGGYRTWRD